MLGAESMQLSRTVHAAGEQSVEALLSETAWHAMPVDAASRALGVAAAQGLSSADADRRLGTLGPNRLVDPPPDPAGAGATILAVDEIGKRVAAWKRTKRRRWAS